MSKANFEGYTIVNHKIFEYDLDAIDIAILLVLKKFMFNTKKICWISIKTIADHINMCYTTVLYRLHNLANRGIISIISGKKEGKANIYEMLVDFFSTLSSAKKGNEKENKITQSRFEMQYQKDNFKEKARNALFPPTQREYDVNVLEEQLLRASRKSLK